MLRKMPWLDRIGILSAFAAVLAITFLWWIGWAALKVLLIAILVTFVFAFILFWAAHKMDDNPDNDTAGAVVTSMKASASQEWDALVLKVKGGGDAQK